MKFGIFVVLVAFVTYGNCASIVGFGADALGHAVPVKCTVDCESAAPSVGPVVPSPLVHSLSGAGPLEPLDPPAAPAEGEALAVPALPLYHPALYGHLGAWNHGLLHHPVAPYAHYPWGYLGHPAVPVIKDAEGEVKNVPLYPYGHPWAPAAPHVYGLHRGLPAYKAYLEALGLKPEDCPPGVLPHLLPHLPHLPFVFDKSAKPVEAETVAVADAAPEATEDAPIA